MSSDKQPLMQGHVPPSAPPAYQPPKQQAPAYAPAYATPPQGGYGGAQTTSNTTTVIMQQPQHHHVLMEIKPPNYIVLSVITMLFFCWVFGLIALVVGTQVDSAWGVGDHEEAHRRSKQAKIWNVVGLVFGIVVHVTWVLIVCISLAA